MLRHLKNMGDAALDVSAISISNKATAGGAMTGVMGWLASVNWIGVAGVLIALVGLIVNIYFQWRRDRRERTESAARMAVLRDRCGL